MFLYFVPQSKVIAIGKNTLSGITKDDLAKLCLPHLEDVIARQILEGPDGQGGWLLWCKRLSEMAAYDAQSQTWRQIAGQWIGYGNLPGPDELRRAEPMDGYAVLLGDDRQWIIPPAREYNEEGYHWCSFPKSLGIDDNGQWGFIDLVPRFRKLWSLVCAYSAAQDEAIEKVRHTGESIKFAFPELNDMCVESLSLNYQVSAIEVSLLGLLTTETRTRITSALMDVDALRRVLEKKRVALGSGATQDGLDASTTDNEVSTSQPSLT